MNKHCRTFNIERLYHQFLKSSGISRDKLPILISKLYEHRFIDLYRSETELELERYSELEKLLNGQHRDELFKLVQSIK